MAEMSGALVFVVKEGGIMDCDQNTLNLVNSIGHDVPLIWEEVDSGIRIKATVFEMLQALFGANQVLSYGNFFSLNDFIMNFGCNNVEIPVETDRDKLFSGWSIACFNCWDGMWMDIFYKTREEHGQIIFPFYFIIPYCKSCRDCDGCEEEYCMDQQSKDRSEFGFAK